MSDNPELDAVNAELAKEKKPQTAKEIHDAKFAELTGQNAAAEDQLPDIGESPEAKEAVEFVMSKGYSESAAKTIVQREGVDLILASKASEGKPRIEIIAPAEPDTQPVSRYGERFDPERHARLPTGEPKTDSTGKFILKEHDYQPPHVPNIVGGN